MTSGPSRQAARTSVEEGSSNFAWSEIVDAVLLALLALAVTWPLPTLADAVPGVNAGDNVTFLWNLWWMREAMASASAAPFATSALFHPFGTSLVLHTHTALAGVVGGTILGTLPLAAAQNAILIGATWLNGCCAYLLGRRLTHNRAAALTTGVFFLACPFFAGHLLGHFNLVHGWVLPLLGLALVRYTESGNLRWMVSAGAVLGLTAYVDYYFLTYGALLVVVFAAAASVACRVTFDRLARPRWSSLDTAAATVLALVVVGASVIALTGGGVVSLGPLRISLTTGTNLKTLGWVLAGVLAWRRLRPRIQIGLRDRASPRRWILHAVVACIVAACVAFPLARAGLTLFTAGDVAAPDRHWRSTMEGIDALSFLAGSPFHPVWGPTVERLYASAGASTIESTGWLGLAALTCLVRWRAVVAHRWARVWLFVGAVFLIWSLGPQLTVAGYRTGLLLPELLLRAIPLLSNVRIPGRAIVIVYLSVAVLLGYAVLASKRRGFAAAGLIGLVLVDFWSAPVKTYAVAVPAIYTRLAALDQGAVLELPLGIRDGLGEYGRPDNAVLLHQTVHGKPIVGGFVARMSARLKASHANTPALRTLLNLSGTPIAPDEAPAHPDEIAGYLRQNGVRYVVVDLNRAPAPLIALVDALPLTLLAEEEGRRLYVVRAS